MTIAMQPIYTQTITNSTTNGITFNNIPQTFTDLKIVFSVRSLASAANNTIFFYFQDGGNNANYSETYAFGTGSSVGSGRVASNSIDYGTGIFAIPGNTTTANSFGSGEIYVPNYTVSGTKKSYIFDVVSENNSATTGIYQELGAGLFHLTTPVTLCGFYLQGGNYLAPNTTFSLYGITKG
jgi:hypothetical protein